MSSKDFLLIKAAVYEMGLLFNQKPDDEKITAYAKALKDFTPAQICFAFNQVIKSGSAFFPSLAEILKHLMPVKESSEDQAIKATEEIVRVAIEHGHNRTQRALDSLSVSTRALVGDDHQIILRICKSMEDELSTIKAQLRNLLRARIDSQKAGDHLIQLTRIGINHKSLLIEANGMRKLDFGSAV